MAGTPNWDGWLASVWGVPREYFGCIPGLYAANNVVVGTNPPYTIQDFLAVYPKFGGPPLSFSGDTTIGSAVVAGISDTSKLSVGNPVKGPGIPNGALITAIAANVSITLSVNATATATGASLTAWTAPLLPFAVLLMYLYMASSSLVEARWLELWQNGMALYIAHFATLYLESDADPLSDAGQAAAAGAAAGVVVSKAVHDVSVAYQPLEFLASWGAYGLTKYGQQLATFAEFVGAGSMLLY